MDLFKKDTFIIKWTFPFRSCHLIQTNFTVYNNIYFENLKILVKF